MRRIIAWLWLVPVPLTFVFELLTNSDWLLIAGNLVAMGASLPVLLRVQRARTATSALWIAVLGLCVGLIVAALAETMSLTALWLSLVALTMLTRLASSWVSIALLVILSVANVIVPSLMPDGLTFGLAVIIAIVVAVSIGLMLRFADRSLAERQATAAEAERRRIATELHDLIAHEVTGIVVLAQAAGRSDNAQLTSTALHKIEESGTRALEEIRRLVSETSTESASRTPVAAGPQALRDRVTAFGPRATISFDAGTDTLTAETDSTPHTTTNTTTPAEADGTANTTAPGAADGTTNATTPTAADGTTKVDSEVWPVLDRVLVESLTNVRRHAGADADVHVTVSLTETMPKELLMTVANGPGAGGIGAGSGTGLSSLRTRVSHLGGVIDAGPEPGGGWSVRTRLPMDRHPRKVHR